ncbi:ABC transporter permease [Opitutaceae bacterium TAV4]|uniref:ABC transporter permease n=1 Tax=Geminisphaera colitermitum TaxID=1148786 RepID=UPI000158D26E|nr:ABC transporter permease [Geminisphaera colitermitum]RRJ96667.1 ABC transporter permease [Opitutaceae bacterium TAV4]RRK00717.1 ABC transporter permease [Opitutaceae bacterium TAV3]
MTPATDPPPATLTIEAGRTELHYWRDLWHYRELLGFLAWRDVKVRYKQAVLGAGWALIQPVITTIIFTVIFGRLAGMPDGGIPYPLLVLSGLLPWQLFASALSGSSGSLVSNAGLISKIYFPRLIVPFSALGVALIDFLIVLALFLAVSLWFGYWPTWHWLALPAFIVMALMTALGAGLWLTALTVKYRDFRFILPFILQIGLFVSPVGFRTDYFPSWQPLLALNPLTGVINGFRWCLLGGSQSLSIPALATAIAIIALLLAGGLWFFRKTERGFADII